MSFIKYLRFNIIFFRLAAETHYLQLRVAQGFNAQYDEVVESLNNAITIIS